MLQLAAGTRLSERERVHLDAGGEPQLEVVKLGDNGIGLRRDPLALPAKMIGGTGRMHGEMAVTRPATNAMLISVAIG